MRVLQIVPSFYPAIYHGGPIHSIYGLCNALAQNGVELRVLTTDTAGPGRRLKIDNFPALAPAGYPIYYCRKWFGVSVSPDIIRHMVPLIRWAEVVHLTAVYSFPTIPALTVCRLLDKPVVWSPRGSLQRWEGSTRPTLKFIWEKACEIVVPKRMVLHVTSEEEARESSERFPGVKIAIIPNGTEIPEQVTHDDGNGVFRILYLGRLDPKKGIENLLTALKEINGHLKWSLKIAGTGEPSYRDKIQLQVQELGLSHQVEMLGTVMGEAKKRLFEISDIVVVPSYTENFGMVVSEALAHGIPVIASRGTPWRRLEEVGCGLWVDNSSQSLAAAIKQMSHLPMREMGQRGKGWIQREFSWSRRATEMAELYHNLILEES